MAGWLDNCFVNSKTFFMTPRATDGNSPETRRSILAICELEQQALRRRTKAELVSDAIVFHAGRIGVIGAHIVWFFGWIVWNSGKIRGLEVFDPFPFSALTTIVSLEAIFLTLMVIMSQNRSSRQAEERAHLDLQINLLAEREATKVLSLLKALCAHHHLPEAQDPELIELLKRIEPADLANEIGATLPGAVSSDKTPE